MRRAVYAVVALGLAGAGIAAASMARPAAPVEAAPPPFPERGSAAPELAAPLLAGELAGSPDTVRLSDYRGRWVYLDVFGSWCAPCRRKYPDMGPIVDSVRALGGDVLGLLLRDDPEDAAGFFAENGGMRYPFALLDADAERDWQITGAPMGFLVSPEGRIERVCWGCAHGSLRVETVPDQIREELARR